MSSFVLCPPAADCCFSQPFSPLTTAGMSDGKLSVSHGSLLSECGAKMVCEAAASRMDGVVWVGISEIAAAVLSDTGSETVEASEDMGRG